MAKNGVLEGRIKEGGYGLTVMASITGHLLLLLGIILVPALFPGIALKPGSGGGGGGQSGEAIIPVTLTDLGGGTGSFKPTPRIEEPAVETTKPLPPKAPEEALPIADPVIPPKRSKREMARPEKTDSRMSPAEQKVKEPPKLPKNYVATQTGPGAGGTGALTAGSQGVGVGFGDGSGGSGGSGAGDSWYARQVEKRIGSNWLRSEVGSVPAGKYSTTISFQVLNDGSIVRVSTEKRSGISTLDDSAERAIKASNPLAPLPPELRGKPVRFTALFEYPPPLR